MSTNLHPVDYCNFNFPFEKIFDGDKVAFIKSATEVCYPNPDDIQDNMNEPTYVYSEDTGVVFVVKANPHRITVGDSISKFHLLSHIKFKGDFKACEAYLAYEVMDLKIPYARIGTSYFMFEEETNRWGGVSRKINIWTKDELKEDHGGKGILKRIPKYNGFCIAPSNTDYSPVHNNRYNLYCPFPHQPHPDHVSTSDIPVTLHLIKHIFGDQFHLGIRYFKVLYEHPTQILPILVLVSEKRETGKTTFINYLSMLFFGNAVLITPQQLTGEFNHAYATKNIIMVDEATFDKDKTVEKLKSLATAKEINVNEKFVPSYSIPFFAKIILCSNKEKKFMRIDSAEIRFWIRKINPITGTKNVDIENDLFNEIPKFIKYISQLPAVDRTKTRMVFTPEEIGTTELEEVKSSSRVGLAKDLQIMIEEWFDNHDGDSFMAGAKDIHHAWFTGDRQIRPYYIAEVLRDEMKMVMQPKQGYYPFNEVGLTRKVSTPFLFKRVGEKFKENDAL